MHGKSPDQASSAGSAMAHADAPAGASPAVSFLAATTGTGAAQAARGTGISQAGVPCLSSRGLAQSGRGTAQAGESPLGWRHGTQGHEHQGTAAAQAGVGCSTGADSVLVLHVLPSL